MATTRVVMATTRVVRTTTRVVMVTSPDKITGRVFEGEPAQQEEDGGGEDEDKVDHAQYLGQPEKGVLQAR